MGIQINGQIDDISATDGGLTISDLEINQSGISTFNAGVGIGDSIFHLGDDNTQIRFPAADTITAETAGGERLRIASDGKVGIGTDDPDRILHITTASPIIKLTDSDNSLSAEINGSSGNIYLDTQNSNRDIIFRGATTEVARITGDGKVGIGSVVPKTDLDIGNVAGGTITLSTLDNSMTTDQTIGKINFYTTDPSGDGEQNSAIISAHSVANTGSGAYIKFSTATGATGSEGADAVERVRIASDGAFTLKPEGDVAEAIRIAPAVDASTQQEFGIGLAVNSNHTHPAAKITFKEFDASDSRGDLYFYTRGANSDSAPTERLIITHTGLVLIGTTTEGNVNADDLTIANSGEGGITIRTGSSSNGNIFFSDATSGAGEYAGYIDYKHGSDVMTFGIGGGTEHFRIGASGDYGTVETTAAKNGWGGYGIVNGASYVFMGDSTQVGIYNDTDNEWMLTATKNGDTFLYSNGAQTLRSYTTGDYGTIQTLASKNGWGGLSVNGQYVFMADASNAGIYNDIDNEWLMYCTRNGGFNLFHNNSLYLNSTGGYIHMAQDSRFESKPNSTWGAGLYFGGNGQAASSTHGSMVVTNGNIHIDARNGGYGTYLNWYSGGNGVYFGNAASGQAGRIDASGNMTVSGGYSGSDLRLKENIKNITGATDLIKSLVGKTYTWKKGIGLDDWNHYGLVAQEVQKVAPDLVRDNGSQFFDKDDNLVNEFDPTESDEDRKNKGLNQSLTVNYEGVTPILVEAMKELIAKVETLEAEVAALKSP